MVAGVSRVSGKASRLMKYEFRYFHLSVGLGTWLTVGRTCQVKSNSNVERAVGLPILNVCLYSVSVIEVIYYIPAPKCRSPLMTGSQQ